MSLGYKRRRVGVIRILSKEENRELPTRNKGPENVVILFNFYNSLCSL